jgi:hypothetical protein
MKLALITAIRGVNALLQAAGTVDAVIGGQF